MKKLVAVLLIVFVGTYSLFSQVATFSLDVGSPVQYVDNNNYDLSAQIHVTYNWYYWESSTNGSSYTKIAGSDNQYGIYDQGVALTQTTYFRLVINTTNVGTINSETFTITIIPTFVPGTISSSKTICKNTSPGTLTISNSYGGTGSYSYQWQVAEGTTYSFSNIGGATSQSLNVGTLSSTKTYRCVTGGGLYGETSNIVTITVLDNFDQGNIGSNQTICYNATPAGLTQTATPTNGMAPYTYKWKYSTNNSSYTDIPGATSESYSPGALAVTTYYRRVVTDACSVVDDGSDKTITLSVRPEVTAGSINSAANTCYNVSPGNITNLTSPGGGDGVNYNYTWQSSPNNSSWTTINGATLSYYNPGNMTQDVYYRRAVTSAGCDPAYSSSVLIDVRPQFLPGTIGSSQVICVGSAPVELAFTTAASAEGSVSYQWQQSANDASWSDIASAVGGNYSPGSLSTLKYFRCKVGTICGDLNTNSVSITMVSPLQAGSVSGDQSICYNTNPDTLANIQSASSGKLPYTYTWQYSTDSINWNNIGNSNNLKLGIDNLTATTQYRQLVTDNCSQTDFSNVISIRVFDKVPDPETNLKNIYCKDSTVGINLINPQGINNWYDKEEDFIQNDTSYSIESLSENDVLYLFSIDDNNCKSDTLKLNINMDPIKANFIRVSNEESAEGTIVKFRSTSTGANSYIWDLGVDNLYYVAEPSTVYNAPGIYDATLTVTSVNGCVDSYTLEDAVIVYPLAINEHIDGSLFVYPLPVTDELTIEYSGTSVSNAFIYNISGQVVLQKKVEDGKNIIDMSSFQNGSYVLKIVHEKGTSYTRTIIKQE